MKLKRLVILAALCCAALAFATPTFAAETGGTSNKELRILFTHDLQSNILPYDTLDQNGNRVTAGGFARLNTLIKQNRTDGSVLLDGGDYAMGSFFNSLYKTEAPELTLMGEMGYDATTIGNHEFDYGADGLKQDLLAASATKVHPTILNSNMVFGDDQTSQDLKSAFEKYGSLSTKIINKNGVKVGVFGMLSQNAQDYTNDTGGVTFASTTETAKNCVAELKSQGADVIVCLSHGGTDPDASKSEDQQLAKDVPDIDVIVSGHTHTTLESPIIQGSTIIVSCGWREEYLGVLDLTLDDSGNVSVKDYALKATASDVAQDTAIQPTIDRFKNDVQNNYLTPIGKSFDNVIATSDHTFSSWDDTLNQFGNYDIGDIITDAYLYESKQNGTGTPADIAVINAGLLRDTIYKGDISDSGAFNILNLGEGSDGSLGYSLVDFYLTGAEVKQLCQMDVTIYPLMHEIQFSFSGLRYTYNDSRLPLDKVISVDARDADGNWAPVENDKLYHLTCSQYVANMTSLASKLTKGIVNITPRDQNGNPVSNTDTLIAKTKSGAEMKEWVALSDYLTSFPKNDAGVSVIPSTYNTARDTKTSVANSPVTFFENPSSIGLAIYGIIAGITLIIVLIIVLVHHKRHKKRKLGAKL